MPRLLELHGADIGQAGHAEGRRGLLALPVPRGVKPIDQRVLHVRVEDPEADARGQRHELETRARAVDEHQVPAVAEAGHALVENTARHADKAVLGMAGQRHNGLARRVLAAEREQRERRRELDRRTAAQPGAHRKVGIRQVFKCARSLQSERLEARPHAEGIVDPSVLACPWRAVLFGNRHESGTATSTQTASRCRESGRRPPTWIDRWPRPSPFLRCSRYGCR